MSLSIASIDVTFIQWGGLISLILKILLGSSNTQLKINMVKLEIKHIKICMVYLNLVTFTQVLKDFSK